MKNEVQPICVDVRTAAALLNIGITSFYALVAEGKLKIIKIGRRSLVVRSDLDDFVQALCDGQQE